VNTPAHGPASVPHPGDALTAVLLQITQHAERLAALDEREASHYQEISARLTELARQLTTTSQEIQDIATTATRQAATLQSLDGLGQHVATLATQLTEMATARFGSNDEPNPGSCQPAPAPRWWKLDGQERDHALARLRAWVEQVYRPSYGHLSAALGPCWEQHPLCLYGLDWLMELWSVLYLSPERDSPALASQAEWQTRLLPALAEQMYIETTRCNHPQPPRSPRDASQASRHGQTEYPKNASAFPESDRG
jgi:hypothetical protein